MLAPGSEGYGFHGRCVFWAASLTDGQAEKIVALIAAAPCEHCHIHFQHCGGAAAERDPAKNAFPFQGLEWSMVVIACWPEPDTEAVGQRCRAWVDEGVAAMAPHSLGTYSVDLGPGDDQLAAYAVGFNLIELTKLKRTWDLGGMFGAGAFPLESLKS